MDRSLFVRIAGIMAVMCVVLSVVIVALNMRTARDLAMSNLTDFASGATQDFAQSSARAIRFDDQAEIANIADRVAELAGNRMSAAVVFNANDELRYSSSNVDTTLLEDAARNVDAVTTLESGSDNFIVAMPVLLGKDQTQVGTVAIQWTVAPVLADLNKQNLVISGIAFAILCAMMLVASMMIRRAITTPLQTIGSQLKAIEDGDYTSEVSFADRGDEIGAFARSIIGLQDRLQASKAMSDQRDSEQADQQHVVAALRSSLNALSKRDLTQALSDPFPPEYEGLRNDFNLGIEGLREIVAAVVDNAKNVEGGAQEISEASDNLAHRTETQAATLEATSRTLDGITGSAEDAAEKVREVERIVLDTRKQTDESDAVVESAVSAMSEIEKSSEEISSIIAVIDDIAFQTNLLALNAGVEAARAGEAGRGFAVVATEVRSLAQRSADAAKDVKTLITGSADQVRLGVELVNSAGEALSAISEKVSHVSGLVSGITAATDAQAGGVAEINTGVTQLEAVTQENAAMVQEANAAGHLLRQQATELIRLVVQFKIEAGQHNAPPSFNAKDKKAA